MRGSQSTSAIAGMGLGSTVALITDGRDHSTALPEERFHRTCVLGSGWADPSHWWKGDIISIDITTTTGWTLKVSDEELAARKADGAPTPPGDESGYLARYASSLVTNADHGAVPGSK